MNHAGLIYDDSRHYIDHLGPFCALAGWPLIVCEGGVADLARRYYPDLEVIEKNLWEVELPPNIVTCATRPLIEAHFPGQKTKTFWLPHGNSDKGWKSPFFEALQHEETALVYGQKMVDFMKEKGVRPKIIRIGNFRWAYFQKHQNFYQNRNPLPSGKNFLYAPTWDDSEDNCSFWKAFPPLTKSLPDECNLIVKLHPNTMQKYEAELEIIKGRYGKKNIHFLDEFPPIYPLLSHCHAYIGDMSSIGYDFLKFDRPLFFLNSNGSYLHQCGSQIKPEKFTFQMEDPFSSIRKKTYHYTFDEFTLRGL